LNAHPACAFCQRRLEKKQECKWDPPPHPSHICVRREKLRLHLKALHTCRAFSYSMRSWFSLALNASALSHWDWAIFVGLEEPIVLLHCRWGVQSNCWRLFHFSVIHMHLDEGGRLG